MVARPLRKFGNRIAPARGVRKELDSVFPEILPFPFKGENLEVCNKK